MKKALIAVLLFSALSLSQVKTMDRRYVPILVSGSQFPRVGLVVQEWSAFRYNRAAGTWTLVPWQVDEVDSDKKYNKEKDGLIDANDEILCMPEDLGDQALAAEWLEDIQARKEQRIELTFTEPKDSQKKGWLYLYRNVSTDQAPASYHQRYSSAPVGTAADTARTLAYTIGHNRDGWIDFVSLSIAPRTDLVDRLKLRFSGDTPFGGMGKYTCSEDTLNNGSSTYHPGLIRAFHDQRTLFSIPKLYNKPVNTDYQLEYYPYSFRIGVEGIKVDPLLLAVAGLKSIRESLDLSPNVAGGKFYSSTNPDGVDIDGKADNLNTSLSATDKAHWLLASGTFGTIMMVVELPQIKNSITKIYYRDNQQGGTADGSLDTGDQSSYSDMGLWAYTLASALVTDRLNIDFNCYFIDTPNQDATFGSRLYQWSQTSPTLNYAEQTFVSTAVQQHNELPQAYHLQPGYPNPFDAATTVWQTSLLSAQTATGLEAVVYNLLGQEIARLSAMSGAQGVTWRWDGRDAVGRRMTAGLYLVQIRAQERSWTQRILLK